MKKQTGFVVAALALSALFGVLLMTANMQASTTVRAQDDDGWEVQYERNDRNDVFFVDASNGWMVSDDGRILHTGDGGDSWSLQPSGTTDDLYGVYFVNANQGWAVGGEYDDIVNEIMHSIILHTDDGGTTWSLQNAGKDVILHAVYFADASHGWAVGNSGTIIHTTNGGDTWSSQSSGTTYYLSGVHFISTSEGWVVGRGRWSGVILHTTDGGVIWSPQSAAVDKRYRAVFFPDTSHGWVVGDEGTVLTLSGTTWVTQTANTSANLTDVYLTDTTHGWATGSDGTILTLSGSAWITQTSGTGKYLFGVHFTSNSEGWVVGENGTLLHTSNGGTTWTKDANTVSDLWAAHFISPTLGWAVGCDYAAVAGPSSVVLRTDDGGATWQDQNPGLGHGLFDLDFANANDGWAVGRDGFILHTDNGGSTWITQTTPVTDEWLRSVSFADANQGWVVGDGGTILHTADGGSIWTAQTSGTGTALFGVHFINSSEGWAVGARYGTGGVIEPVVLHTDDDGSVWSSQNLTHEVWLEDAYFTDANNGWVVGFYADYVDSVREFKEAILHTDDGGDTWGFQHQGSEADHYLYGLHLLDTQHGWAVGNEGAVLRTTDGSTWERQGCVTGQSLMDVHFADAQHGWAVGSAGTIIYSETGGVQPTPTPTLTPTPTSTPVPTPTPTPYPEPIAFGIPQWQENGLPMAVFTKTQYGPMMVSDDAGGAILSWKDYRHAPDGTFLYAQRVSSDGQLLWATDGVSVSDSMGQNWDTHPMVSDGAGGAIVVWLDYQDISDPDDDQLYAQRLDANGQPLWTPGGVPLSTGNNYVYWLRTTSDGQGGVIAVWEDDRNVEHETDIYAQRLDANGNQMWSANDLAVCIAADDQIRSELTSDGASGAIIAWIDDRNEDISGPASLGDIYAQRVSAGGTPLWTTDGVTVCTAINGQYFPRLVPDGSGGAIIAWNDSRTGGDYGHQDMYVQRVDANGVAQWTADGVMVCDAPNDQWYHDLVSDGAGGAILFWEDYRRGRSDIYAQRVNASGTPLWRPNGIPAGDHPAGQFYPLVVPDGAGGALAAWKSGGSLYAQRVTRDGVVFWEPGLGSFVGGWAVRPQPGHRVAVASSDGGIIVAWTDDHSGDDDVYAQKVLELHPDLWLTKTPHAATVAPGEPVIYNLAYINTMTGTVAVSAFITDDVPVFTTFVACAGGQACDPVGDVVVWYLGDVPASSGGIVTLTLRASGTAIPGIVITNTAVFSSPAASAPAVATADVRIGGWPYDLYLPLVMRQLEGLVLRQFSQGRKE